MSHEYQILNGKIDAALRELKSYPVTPNQQNQKKLDLLKAYADKRVDGEPALEYSISCSNSGFSLSDILNYTAQAPLKDSELLIVQSSFITEEPQPEPVPTPQPSPKPSPAGGEPAPAPTPVPTPAPKQPRKVALKVPSKVMTVQEYKTLLTTQLTALAAAKPDDEIELTIDIDTNINSEGL